MKNKFSFLTSGYRDVTNNTSGITPPTVIINSQTDLWLGDRQVRIERVDGHSAGTDLVAYIPDAKVLFTGDMVLSLYNLEEIFWIGLMGFIETLAM